MSYFRSYLKKNNTILNEITIPDNFNSFIMEVEVVDNDDFVLPLINTANYNFEVDYGDGTVNTVNSYNDAAATHTYDTAGIYQIIITGLCERLYFYDKPQHRYKVTRIIQWGNVGFTSMERAFYYCNNLSELPETPITGCESVEDFSSCFISNNINTIPTGFFNKCTNAKNFSNCFNTNTLIDIPKNLFKYCEYIEDLSYCFYLNITLYEPVPELWVKYPNVISEGCFGYCFNIENYNEIPSTWK